MGNRFDGYKKRVFDATTRAMGYTATWTPSTGGAEQTAQVHLRAPGDREILRDQKFTPEKPVMEYRGGFFVGLYDLLRNKNTNETITIVKDDAELVYDCLNETAEWDGDTFKVSLQSK
jgi:hypothetical protein